MASGGGRSLREKFAAVTGFVKDTIWWLTAIFFVVGGGGVAVVHRFIAKSPFILLLIAGLLGFVGVGILAVFALYYQRRCWRYARAGFYVHHLTHDLRDKLVYQKVKELLASTTPPGETKKLASYQKELLRDILDNAAHAFRCLTGDEWCVASLLMPEDEGGKEVLKSVMYCSDVDPERVKSSCAQTGGLAFLVLRSSTAQIYNDYEKELAHGLFEEHRKDWRNWYMSGIMAHFNVGGKPWGVFNVDSRKKGIFRSDHKNLLCAFADACGLVFGLGNIADKGGGHGEEQ